MCVFLILTLKPSLDRQGAVHWLQCDMTILFKGLE